MRHEVRNVLIIGNSDGIGLELTQTLLDQGYQVTGISKRESVLSHPQYCHFVQDVTQPQYRPLLMQILNAKTPLHLCVYCAGIGGPFQSENLGFETHVFQVNLLSAAVTTELVIEKMLRQNQGHFIGLSSIADSITSAEAPSYSASKAGISKYWEGLGLALSSKNVKISNIRFGFVDTKMAKSSIKPWLLSRKEAVQFILKIIEHPRLRATKPIPIAVISWLLNLFIQFKIRFLMH